MSLHAVEEKQHAGRKETSGSFATVLPGVPTASGVFPNGRVRRWLRGAILGVWYMPHDEPCCFVPILR